MSPHAQELLNIEVAVIGRRPFVRSIHTFGRVAAGRKRIDAELHRDDLRYVTRGLRATIGLPSASDRIEGTILSIDRVPKALMQTVAMMIQVADSAELEPRMVVDVMIDVDLGEGTAVPDEAVLPNGSGSIVFVDRGDGVYDPREIETGPQWDGHYRVEKGLAEGDKVVVNAAFLLDSESRIKAAQKEAAHVH